LGSGACADKPTRGDAASRLRRQMFFSPSFAFPYRETSNVWLRAVEQGPLRSHHRLQRHCRGSADPCWGRHSTQKRKGCPSPKFIRLADLWKKNAKGSVIPNPSQKLARPHALPASRQQLLGQSQALSLD